jgi:hypothetical protein
LLAALHVLAELEELAGDAALGELGRGILELLAERRVLGLELEISS